MELAPGLVSTTEPFGILASIFILVSHIGILVLEDLELVLDRLRFEIRVMRFIFPMEKKIAKRFCI